MGMPTAQGTDITVLSEWQDKSKNSIPSYCEFQNVTTYRYLFASPIQLSSLPRITDTCSISFFYKIVYFSQHGFSQDQYILYSRPLFWEQYTEYSIPHSLTKCAMYKIAKHFSLPASAAQHYLSNYTVQHPFLPRKGTHCTEFNITVTSTPCTAFFCLGKFDVYSISPNGNGTSYVMWHHSVANSPFPICGITDI